MQLLATNATVQVEPPVLPLDIVELLEVTQDTVAAPGAPEVMAVQALPHELLGRTMGQVEVPAVINLATELQREIVAIMGTVDRDQVRLEVVVIAVLHLQEVQAEVAIAVAQEALEVVVTVVQDQEAHVAQVVLDDQVVVALLLEEVVLQEAEVAEEVEAKTLFS